MTILADIVVKNGSYTDREGNEKKRYVNIGHLHEGQHGKYITLDAHVNLAGFERKDGDTRVFANLYKKKDRQQEGGQQEGGRRQAPAPEPSTGDFDDDIPF